MCVPEWIFQLFANSIKLCLDKFLLFDKLRYTCTENYIPSILFIHLIYLHNGNSSIFQKDWDIFSPGGILGSEIFPSLYLKKCQFSKVLNVELFWIWHGKSNIYSRTLQLHRFWIHFHSIIIIFYIFYRDDFI